MAKTFLGRDVVLFRTTAGEAAVFDAFCPHMGAHMGMDGVVEGETIRCPMHGFCFDTAGTCTKTGYGTEPPKKAQAAAWHVHEVHGFVLAWFHPQNEAPGWRVPTLDFTGWAPQQTHLFPSLRSHPQETSENSVDFGHFPIVHGYRDCEVLVPVATEGPLLTAKYALHRAVGWLPGIEEVVRAEFSVEVHGLGYSIVDGVVPKQQLHTKHWVLNTPTDGNTVELRLASQLAPIESRRKLHPAAALLPHRLLRKVVADRVMKEYIHDVFQDFVIWENKTYLHPPVLAKGDGPVGRYRAWARQFYPGDPSADALVQLPQAAS